jgi:hypothetical protein
VIDGKRARSLGLWAAGAAAIVAGALVRLLLLPAEGLTGDLDKFTEWIGHIARNGVTQAYDADLAFGPVLTLIWGAVAAADPGFATATDSSDPGLRVLMKLPAVLADVGIAAVVAYALRGRRTWAVVGAAVVLLHPAIWYVSAWWGQFESVYTLAAVVAVLLAINGRDGFAAAALAVAVLTKPQAIPFVVPFVAWFYARGGPIAVVRAAVIGGAVALVLWLPFLAAGGPGRYLASLSGYQEGIFSVLSLRAWNGWWLLQELGASGEFASDRTALIGPVTFRLIGFVVAGLAWLVIAVGVWRDPRPRTLILGLAASSLAAFTFLTTMHERYAYPAVVLLLLLAPEPRIRWLGAALGAVVTLNLVAAAPATDDLGRLLPVSGWLGIFGSIAMVALTIAVIGLLRAPRPATAAAD